MECLGTVETVTREGRFVVKAVPTPSVGDAVFDPKGNKIGSVRRIFGPVDGPYITVSCDDPSALDNITGKKVFFKGEVRNAKGKRRNR